MIGLVKSKASLHIVLLNKISLIHEFVYLIRSNIIFLKENQLCPNKAIYSSINMVL